MKCVVRSRLGYYYRRPNGIPGWTQNHKDAKVFSNKGIARRLISLLRGPQGKAHILPADCVGDTRR